MTIGNFKKVCSFIILFFVPASQHSCRFGMTGDWHNIYLLCPHKKHRLFRFPMPYISIIILSVVSKTDKFPLKAHSGFFFGFLAIDPNFRFAYN